MTYEGKVGISNLNLHSEATGAPALQVEKFSFGGAVVVPLQGRAWETAVLREGHWSAESMLLSKVQATALGGNLAAEKGHLWASQTKATAFSGQFNGEGDGDLVQGTLTKAKVQIAHVDQHQALANLAPEKIDAEGPMSGTVELWTEAGAGGQAGGPLQMKGDLTADKEGRLMVKDESISKQLGGNLAGVNAGPLMPKDYGNIVIGQLKNYPYLQGHIQLSMAGKHPELQLSYKRPSLKEGEPGYNIPVETVVKGVKVTVPMSYAVQLAGVSVELRHMTIEELLGKIVGWENTLFVPPASQPK
jgi:hypothetical protein